MKRLLIPLLLLGLFLQRLIMTWRYWRDPDLQFDFRRAWRTAGRYV